MKKELNILIYAKPEIVEHKMRDRLSPEISNCYWIGKCPTKKKLYEIKRVYFSNGSYIYAEGEFLYGQSLINEQISFLPLKRVNKKQPRKPPTRGWCYCETI